jgi:hypothetical protein
MFKHIDNHIYIDDYECTLSELQHAVPIYQGLPDGMTVRMYDGTTHRLHSEDTQYAGDVPWEIGDYIITNAETIKSTIKTSRTESIATLHEVLTDKTVAIRTEKRRARDAGFDVEGMQFDSDAAARIAYLELAKNLGNDPTYSTRWRASEGIWTTMGAALFAKVEAGLKAHIAAVFAWQAAREAELTKNQAAVASKTMTEEMARTAVEAISAQYP